MHITNRKKPVWKINMLYDSNIQERQNNGKKARSVIGRVEMGRGWWTDHPGFLGQWNYSVWYYHDGYTTLYICQNPQNYTKQTVNPNVNYRL